MVDTNGETPVSAMVAGITKEVMQQTCYCKIFHLTMAVLSFDVIYSFLSQDIVLG